MGEAVVGEEEGEVVGVDGVVGGPGVAVAGVEFDGGVAGGCGGCGCGGCGVAGGVGGWWLGGDAEAGGAAVGVGEGLGEGAQGRGGGAGWVVRVAGVLVSSRIQAGWPGAAVVWPSQGVWGWGVRVDVGFGFGGQGDGVWGCRRRSSGIG